MVEVLEKCIRGPWIDLHNVIVDNILVKRSSPDSCGFFKHLSLRDDCTVEAKALKLRGGESRPSRSSAYKGLFPRAESGLGNQPHYSNTVSFKYRRSAVKLDLQPLSCRYLNPRRCQPGAHINRTSTGHFQCFFEGLVHPLPSTTHHYRYLCASRL
jgi:hypothetical protein